LAPISFEIPRPFETQLSNGLRIIVFEDARVPLVSFRLAFAAGDINDPAEFTGLSSAVASMVSEGTRDYTSLQLAEKVERLGAGLSASSTDDFTIVSASALSLYSSEVLQLMGEVVLRPTFPEDELDLYRRNMTENLKFQRSQPGFLANEQSARLIFGEHPYSKISPGVADIERLDRATLTKFHSETFIPNNAVLIVVGHVDRDELIGKVEDIFGDWQQGTIADAEFVAFPKRETRSLTIVDRPGSAQANIVLTNFAIKRTDADFFPMLVMNQVLGAGASSRVFMNLREDKGYTYGAYTRLSTKRYGGDIEATAEVRTAVTGDSLKEFFYELDRIREERVNEQELADAKNFLTGVFPIRAETQEGLTNLIVNQYLYGLPEDYLQTYRQNIEAVTSEDVLRVAQKHLRTAEMAVVIVGDADEVLPQASSYAHSVEIFDIDGNLQDVSKYAQKGTDETTNAAGDWSLTIDFQGQALPVKLNVEQNGQDLTGVLETMLGNGEIADGKVIGNKLSAVAMADMQGQAIKFEILGKIDADTMNGTITAPMVPEALPFTGTRQKG